MFVHGFTPLMQTLFTECQSEIIQLHVHPDSTFCDISIKKILKMMMAVLRYQGHDTTAHGVKSYKIVSLDVFYNFSIKS